MRVLRRRLGLLAATAALCFPHTARAQVSLELGSWQSFLWFDGVGPTDLPADGFLLSLLHPGVLRITDGFVTGDAFDLFVDGVSRLSTPSVATGVDTGLSGSAAWGDPRLSKGELFLGPGSYLIEVTVREDAGFGFGEGFLRADRTVAASEPGGLGILLAGLLLMAGWARKPRHAPGRG